MSQANQESLPAELTPSLVPSPKSASEKKNSRMINNLTGLRFYAAFLVFISHMYHFNHFGIQGPLLKVLSDFGHLGVTLFYILSGFVLFVNYMPSPERKLSLKSFYIARLARIYPVFLVTTLLAIPLEIFSPNKTAFWLPFGMNLSLTHCMLGPTCGTFNDVGWSIGVEFFFYLLFPMLIALFLAPARLGTVVTGILLYLVGISMCLPQENFYGGAHFPVNRTLEFIAGLCGGYLYMNTNPGFGILKNSPLAKWSCRTIVFILAGILATLPLLTEKMGVWNNIYYIFYIIPGLSFILLLAWMEKYQGPFALFASALVIYGGEISYSLYLIHNLILRYMRYGSLIVLDLDVRTAALPIQIGLAALALTVTLIASALLYRYIEVPYRKKVKDFFNQA